MNGQKFDTGKPMAGLMMKDFARALIEVAKVTTYGCQKYGSPSGWQKVPNALARYQDALSRHQLADALTPTDEESNLRHKAHLAWNALATLELALIEEENTP